MTETSIAGDKCPEKSTGGRTCKLAPEHDGKHVFMVRKAASEQPKLPAGLTLTATAVGKADIVEKTRAGSAPKPRDADQRKIDADAAKNYRANLQAGKHSGMPFEEFRVSEYVVPPAAVDAVTAYLRRAADAGGPGKNGLFRYRKGTHASGSIRVQFAFVPPKSEGA